MFQQGNEGQKCFLPRTFKTLFWPLKEFFYRNIEAEVSLENLPLVKPIERTKSVCLNESKVTFEEQNISAEICILHTYHFFLLLVLHGIGRVATANVWCSAENAKLKPRSLMRAVLVLFYAFEIRCLTVQGKISANSKIVRHWWCDSGWNLDNQHTTKMFKIS